MNPFDDDEEFDLIVDQIVTNTIQATQLIIQRIQNGEAEPSNPRPRGPNKDRGREDGHDKLVADYFSDNPVYNDEDFKRRFRMSRRLFVRIVSDLEREFDCFKQQWDARGVKGFSPLQKSSDSSFVANNVHYHHGYYLADGIYPEWTTFVKAFRYPVEVPRVQFTTRQESARKDIERTFATLKSKWHVVARPARVWSRRKLQEIMYTCIILHNMIREDEGFSHYPFDPTEVLPSEVETTISEEERANNVNFVKNRERHANLRADLSQHLWDSMHHN
ncbi:hypothetical protein OSB04_012805 [Centaurea solstitialis]|uniref:Transposase n=1 Tax=Centaurea solstitialis TaxID=347529 RepID=A0AA38TMP0_9ASTR|nr:hypothetical protein OSB04_012805 [Centaurea solstitialis]